MSRLQVVQKHLMASASDNNKSNTQQPQIPSFATSQLRDMMPARDIWNTTSSGNTARKNSADANAPADHTRAQNAQVMQAHMNHSEIPLGSLHNTAGAPWGSNPWGSGGLRSSSTSPNRTRENGQPRGSTFTSAADNNSSDNFRNGARIPPILSSMPTTAMMSYPSGSSQQRPRLFDANENPLATHASRDSSAPPSRQSQNSPAALSDLYNGDRYTGRAPGHGHSNSFHSQRPIGSQSMGLSHQSANSRAFNLNNQIDGEISMPYQRRVTVDHTASGTGLMDPSTLSQSQSLAFGDVGGAKLLNGHDSDVDALASRLNSMPRPSDSPTGSFQTSAWPAGSSWNGAQRNFQKADPERRGSAQSQASGYVPQYYQHYQPTNGNSNLYQQVNSGTDFSNLGVGPNFTQDPVSQLAYFHQMQANPRSYTLHGSHLPYQLPHLPTGGPPIRPAAEHDPTRGMRSEKLEQFKNNRSNKKWDLADIGDCVVEFSGDQHGSRFIQMKLETANSEEKDLVFRQIEPNAIQLMKDVFGNYVVQKFFEHGNQVQKRLLAEKIKSKMVDLSLQVYACRVVQKALEHVLLEQQLELIKEVEPETIRVMLDQNGNHVIQKMLVVLERKHLDFLFEGIRGQVMMLSNHQYGCRVVQRLMDYGTDEDKDAIVAELRPSAHLLLGDQYGNYVAQHILITGNFDDRVEMVKLVLDQLLELCKHKFASNVVEKCIINGVPALRTMIHKRLESPTSDGTSILAQLMKDSFGNYVIQKMATFLTGQEQTEFIEQIKPLFHLLKKNGNSKQLAVMEHMVEQHERNELKPDPKGYKNMTIVTPAPGITTPEEVPLPRKGSAASSVGSGVNGKSSSTSSFRH